MASVSVQNLSIAIGKNTILQNININFREGKRTAIIGPNGCGKSTLLRAVAGLNRNYSGKVLLNGADMKNMPRRKIAELLAILPQGVTAPADLTVRELVACGRFPYRSLFKREGKNDAEIIETAMQKTHIAHLAGVLWQRFQAVNASVLGLPWHWHSSRRFFCLMNQQLTLILRISWKLCRLLPNLTLRKT